MELADLFKTKNHIEVPSGTYDMTDNQPTYLRGMGSLTAVGGPVTFVGKHSQTLIRMQPGSDLSLRGIKFVDFGTAVYTENIGGDQLGGLSIDRCQFEGCRRVVYAKAESPSFRFVDIQNCKFKGGLATQLWLRNGWSDSCNLSNLDFQGGFSRCIMVGYGKGGRQQESSLVSIRDIAIKGLRGDAAIWRGDIHAIFVSGVDADIHGIRGENVYSDAVPGGGVHNDVCSALIYTNIVRGNISDVIAYNCGGQGHYGAITTKGVAPNETSAHPDLPLTQDIRISNVNITLDENWPPEGEPALRGIHVASPYTSVSGANLVGCHLHTEIRPYQFSASDVEIRNRPHGRAGFSIINVGGRTTLTNCRDSFPNPDAGNSGFGFFGFDRNPFLGTGELILNGCTATNYLHVRGAKIAAVYGGQVKTATTGRIYSDSTVDISHDETALHGDGESPHEHLKRFDESIAKDERALDEIDSDVAFDGDPE